MPERFRSSLVHSRDEYKEYFFVLVESANFHANFLVI